MILQMIVLSGWRCFLEEVPVGPFAEGLNVISGPNGIGKSTLFEALRRALMDSTAVTGQEVIALQPWGRALAPRVTVSFSHGGVEYRLTKQFLEGAFSRLERKETGDFRPLAEGRQADEQVRELLTRNPPGRGLSQSRNWGLAQVLWAPQGELKLTDLSGDLVSDIRDYLGVQVSDKASTPIEQKVSEHYDRFFTRQGKLKSGKAAPPSVRLMEDLERARQRCSEARDLLQRCEEASQRVEELRARHQQMRLEAAELTQSIEKTRKGADQYRVIKTECKNRQSGLETIEARYRQLRQHIELIRSTEKERREAQDEQARLEAEEPLKRRDVEARQAGAIAAKRDLEKARHEEDAGTRAERDAEAARLYGDWKSRRADLGSRVRKAETAEQMVLAHKQARVTLVAPDGRTLKALQKAIQERKEARLLMDASMISLEIVPEADQFLSVISGEETGGRPISAGQAAVIKGSPEILAELKGVARLRASGPGGDVQTHRRTLREREEQILELTRPFGSADIGHLEELAEKAQNLDRQIRESQKELETLLGEDEFEELRKEYARVAALIAGIEGEHPGWKDSPPDKEALKRAAADLKREYNRKVSEAEAAWEGAQNVLSAAIQQEQVLLGRLENARSSARKLAGKLADLAGDGQTLAEREKELNRILLEWDAGKTTLRDLQEKLDPFAGDWEATLEKLERSYQALQDSAQKIRDEELTVKGHLETLTAQGPYSNLAQAEEEVAQLAAEIQREELRMNAIRLLHDTLNQCRSEMVASVVQPVEEEATRLLQRIAGRRLGRIRMGETFEPAGVSPDLAGFSIGLENLSGGEQEQLYLATRLALAEVLAKDERQLVVLDDVLTATDSGRLARIMNLLEEAAGRLQIIILTCHPERYRALTAAEFFNLESRMGRP
ncbi:MAG: SMC family ATPase [Deltaproteobacteria bacterium]|nr:SMC family ATPase [Deltaproteobacteria bacterium]